MKKLAFWLVAILVTLALLVYQRMTGPTYPLQGKVAIGESLIKFKLARSAETTNDCQIAVRVLDQRITGHLIYKRFKTDDPWQEVPLERREDLLIASLPKQPSAKKLAYKVILTSQEKEISLSGERTVNIRFRDPVPAGLLIPHIIVMFLAFLFSIRAGLEALDPKGNPRKLALWTTVLLFIGGMILGPLVQKFAFGIFWSGFPFGHDLTDNKTIIALIGWIVALIAGRGGKPSRWWVFAASVLLLAVYFIPHSLLGSGSDF
mgnify:CR=1 FL=1